VIVGDKSPAVHVVAGRAPDGLTRLRGRELRFGLVSLVLLVLGCASACSGQGLNEKVVVVSKSPTQVCWQSQFGNAGCFDHRFGAPLLALSVGECAHVESAAESISARPTPCDGLRPSITSGTPPGTATGSPGTVGR
jgi:hypothetical protein